MKGLKEKKKTFGSPTIYLCSKASFTTNPPYPLLTVCNKPIPLLFFFNTCYYTVANQVAMIVYKVSTRCTPLFLIPL